MTDAGAYKVEYRRSSSISWLHAGYVYSSTSDTVDGLDCDTSYDFRVRARGDGSPYPTTYGNPSSSVSETTSTCPNRPPAFNNAPYSFSVNEDDANGTRVGTVVAADPDAGDAVSYSITPASTKFAIGSTSGVITVADVLDHEAQSSYVLTVEANDSNGGRGTATVSIVVTDVNEVSISGPGNVVEGADMTFTVTADQGGVTVTYEISGTATRDPNGDYVDPGLGPLTVTIPSGATTQTIVIETNSDTDAETFESVTVALIGVAVGNAVIDSANGSATGRIADLISVSSIDDDEEAPAIEISTSEMTSTLWFKLAGDGGLFDFNHYNNRAYVIRVEAQRVGGANWEPGKIISAKTGENYQSDLPRFGDLGDGQASWVEGNDALDHRYILLDVERPANINNLSKYRITLSKPDYTLIEPEWSLPAPGDTTGTLNVRIGVRNSSDDASDDRTGDPSVDNVDRVQLTCTVGGQSRSSSYTFQLLRQGREEFLDGESDQRIDLGTLCHGLTLRPLIDQIESLKVSLYVDSSMPIQESVYRPEPQPVWPLAVTDTMWHRQSNMMGGLQLVTSSLCTSSFSVELKPKSAAAINLHGSASDLQAMSTTRHCHTMGDSWNQGSRITTGTGWDLVPLGTILLEPATTTCMFKHL